MSYSAIYTPLHPLDTEPSSMEREPGAVTPGAKITDRDGFYRALPDWGTEVHTHEHTESDSYPGRTYEYLEGFKTWDFDEFNIERLAIPSDDAVQFWARISLYTEPFQFFTAPYDGGWPHVLDVVTAAAGTTATYHVVCWNGDIWVEEIGVERTDRDRVYTGHAEERTPLLAEV